MMRELTKLLAKMAEIAPLPWKADIDDESIEHAAMWTGKFYTAATDARSTWTSYDTPDERLTPIAQFIEAAVNAVPELIGRLLPAKNESLLAIEAQKLDRSAEADRRVESWRVEPRRIRDHDERVDQGCVMSRKPKPPKTLPKWIKSWCCQAVALRMGGDLRCQCCGNMLFDDYAEQRLIIDGEPYDPSETIPDPF